MPHRNEILPRWSNPVRRDGYADALSELHGEAQTSASDWVDECNAWSELSEKRLTPRGNGVDLLLASLRHFEG